MSDNDRGTWIHLLKKTEGNPEKFDLETETIGAWSTIYTALCGENIADNIHRFTSLATNVTCPQCRQILTNEGNQLNEGNVFLLIRAAITMRQRQKSKNSAPMTGAEILEAEIYFDTILAQVLHDLDKMDTERVVLSMDEAIKENFKRIMDGK